MLWDTVHGGLVRRNAHGQEVHALHLWLFEHFGGFQCRQHVLRSHEDGKPEKERSMEEWAFGFGFILPSITWAFVSLELLLLCCQLFKRKPWVSRPGAGKTAMVRDCHGYVEALGEEGSQG